MFRPVRVYIKLMKDKVEITNLETSETVSVQAVRSFSSIRNIISNFSNAKNTIQAALNELGIKHSLLGPNLKVLIQQLEGTEGGLSDIERRALRDIGEMAGGRKVFIVEHSTLLSKNEALAELGSG